MAILDMAMESFVEEYPEFKIDSVICGCAEGIDRLGWVWAKRQNPKIPVIFIPAWKEQKEWAESVLDKQSGDRIVYPPKGSDSGKGAGPQRNERMAHWGDALLAINTGSPGTRNMIMQAKLADINPIVEYIYESRSKK